MNKPDAPSANWTERYETLRGHFVRQAQVLAEAPLGAALLRCQGMAGWMRAWKSCVQSESTTSVSATHALPVPCSTDWQLELTRLIAQMTSNHLDLPSKP